MKKRYGPCICCAALLGLLLAIVSCDKDEESSVTGGTSTPTYGMTDLHGTWKGEAKNSSNTVQLNVTVDSQCKATGSGVSCTWSIDNTGKVTGSGSFSFVSGPYLTVAASSWSLQMSSDKKSMTGTMEVAYPTLHGMSTTLTKQ